MTSLIDRISPFLFLGSATSSQLKTAENMFKFTLKYVKTPFSD